MEILRRACTKLGIRALISLGALTVVGGPALAQSWVDTRRGPAPGDSGPRIDAIIQRHILNIVQSPARLEKGGKVNWRKLVQETAGMERVAEVAANVTTYKDASQPQEGRYSYWVQVFNEHQGQFSKAAVIMHPGSK